MDIDQDTKAGDLIGYRPGHQGRWPDCDLDVAIIYFDAVDLCKLLTRSKQNKICFVRVQLQSVG